ncbi:MAG TPA: CAP domain-containing protein [Gammaproteobacteria bacterium]|nr:CAP domain-containing protein [Gammaproteobacteria bacterium]
MSNAGTTTDRPRFWRTITAPQRRVPAYAAIALVGTAGVFAPISGGARAQTGDEAKAPAAGLGSASRTDAAVDLDAVAQRIAESTNEFRRKHARETLRVDDRLEAAAKYFAGYMAGTGKYGHTADGREPSERAKSRGYDFCAIAENIAYAYSSSGFSAESLTQALVQGWIHSPPHRKNMLDAALADIGVGVAYSAKTGYYYAVQDFGRPKSATIDITVTNESAVRLEYRLGARTFSLPPRLTRTHTECRPEALSFTLPGRTSPLRFEPRPKDHFVVVSRLGRLEVERRR